MIAILRIYKVSISPWLPSACRFYPSCSEYVRQAIETHGVMRGLWIGGKRVLRCHPFHPGGVDPIPRKHELWGGPPGPRPTPASACLPFDEERVQGDPRGPGGPPHNVALR